MGEFSEESDYENALKHIEKEIKDECDIQVDYNVCWLWALVLGPIGISTTN
jgi:hypothetical protein